MAYLDFTNATGTSITVRLSGLDASYQANMGTSKLPRHNSYKVSCRGSTRMLSKGSGGNSGTAAFGGLSPGTEYDFTGTVSFTDLKGNTTNVIIEGSCSTEDDVRPDNWFWWSTVAPGQPIALSAAEWNAFCGRIDEFRVYTGRDVWPGWLPVGSGTDISADIVNEARRAIAPMGPTAPLPPWVNPGDTIKAFYFNTLRAYLNSVP